MKEKTHGAWSGERGEKDFTTKVTEDEKQGAMEKKEDPRLRFKLIPGGRRSGVAIGSVRIFAAPEDRPPFPVEAVVLEEDTYLVLSAGWDRIESDDHPVVILTEAFDAQPEEPGSVVVPGDSPLRFLAVVYDFDREPSWKEEWVERAIEGIFREAERRRLQTIALPFLGTKHGSLKKERFLLLLRKFFERNRSPYPLRVWLALPGETSPTIIDLLDEDPGKKG